MAGDFQLPDLDPRGAGLPDLDPTGQGAPDLDDLKPRLAKVGPLDLPAVVPQAAMYNNTDFDVRPWDGF